MRNYSQIICVNRIGKKYYFSKIYSTFFLFSSHLSKIDIADQTGLIFHKNLG